MGNTMTKLFAAVLALFTGTPSLASSTQAGAATAFDFSFTSIEDEALPLSQYRGKAVLVVNTASLCGFTPQYEGLQALWQTYGDKGLVVLGVPSNDFGGQEPGSSSEIKDFCATNYLVTFPLTDKEVVSGSNAHPFYKWARAELGVLAAPKWNFHKYLIAPNGRLVDWFSTTTKPGSRKIAKAIEAVLP